MLCNLHTHTTFCDGNNSPEEIVLAAIEKGFHSIGFSGHGYTPYDLRYCMKDTKGYLAEIKDLKEKYKKDIEIYLGIEEDSHALVERDSFDYLIGSSHYCLNGGTYYPVDSECEYLKKCIASFHDDPISFAKAYYSAFCEYIHKRKPDIVGHFDVITKRDETQTNLFLHNPEYHKIAEEYIGYAATSGCLFEVNTGAMARGIRTSPYPYENLLQVLRKNGNGIVLSSDAHRAEKLDFGFADAKLFLKDMGFTNAYVLSHGQFVPEAL